MKKIIAAIGVICVVVLLGASVPNIIWMTNRTPHDIGSTLAQLHGLSNAIRIYETEYSKRLKFTSSRQLLEVLEGKNEKGIKFYSFSERERNKEHRIVDYWDRPIIAVSHDQGYTLISAGRNGIFDHLEHEDDIIIHIPTQAQPVGR